MKINVQLLMDHINMARVGGLVNEAVFGDRLSFALTDESRSVVSICSRGLADGENSEIGIFNLGLFSKAVQYVKDTISTNSAEIDMVVGKNWILFSNGNDEFKFLLSSPKAISTAVENIDDVLEKVNVEDATVINLDTSTRGKCLKAIKLIAPEKCIFEVDSGKVRLLIGSEMEHNAAVNLGAVKEGEKFRLVVSPDFLVKVLGVMPADEDARIKLAEGMPLIFNAANYTLLLASW